MSESDDRFRGDKRIELEQLIRAAGEYVVVSEELRARVVDAGRRERETIRLRRGVVWGSGIAVAVSGLVAVTLLLVGTWQQAPDWTVERATNAASEAGPAVPAARVRAGGWVTHPRLWFDGNVRPDARRDR